MIRIFYIILLLSIFPKSLMAISTQEAQNMAEIFVRDNQDKVNNTNNLKIDIVPNYQEDVEEKKYYTNPNAIETDSQAKADSDENTQIIQRSFDEKKKFKDDAQKIKLSVSNIQKNPEEIIEDVQSQPISNKLLSQYEECTESEDKATSYTIKRCDEYKNIKNTCYLGQLIEIDNNTNYLCKKTKEYYEKTITKNRIVSCKKTAHELPHTIYMSFPHYYFRDNDHILGYITPNRMYQNCGGYNYYWRFNLNSLDSMEELRFLWGRADDRTLIYVNNHLVHNYPNHGCELGRTFHNAPNKDLKPYLKIGNNEIRIRIIVGGRGEARGEFKVKYKTCKEFNDKWNTDIKRDVIKFDSSKTEHCSNISTERCLLSGKYTTIGGYPRNDCRKKQSIQRCTQNNFTDYCKTISKVESCFKKESNCNSSEQGECSGFIEKYQCNDSVYNSKKENEILLDKPYSLFFGKITPFRCQNNNNLTHCDDISSLNDDKSCYLGTNIDECSDIINDKNCVYQKDFCFDKDCYHKEKIFHCNNNEESKKEEYVTCSKQTYCLSEDCTENIKYSANKNLPKIATYLKTLEAIQKDSDKDTIDIKIFTGNSNKCDKDVFNSRNCCKDSGWGENVGIGNCTYQEKNLGLMKEENQCVYVGSYCSKKEKLTNTCLKKSQSYCCFSGQLAKIIQNQGRRQLGMSFGSDESPNCRGFTPEELQRIKFDQIDFSAYTRELTIDLQDMSEEKLEGSILKEIENSQPIN